MQTNEVTWAQLGPRYGALGNQDLTAENVGDWLSKWSELGKEVEEQLATLQRAKDENTRDKAAESAYLTFVHDVRPPLEVANQCLRLKLLNLRDHEPSSKTAEFVKRFHNEAELFRDANAPLLAEETTLSSDYNTPLGGLTVELDGSALTLPEAEKRLLKLEPRATLASGSRGQAARQW